MSSSITLPPEILGAVFLETLPKKRNPRRIPQEVILSHVCRSWRDTAIGFSQLWAHMVIYSGDSIAWLPSYLERSKPCYLNVRVDTYEIDKKLSLHNGTIASLKPVFDLIVSNVERVQYFFWFTYAETTVEGLCHLFDNLPAPALERFRIIANRHRLRWKRSGAQRTIFNGGVPSLRLVDLEATWTLPRLENVTTLMLGMICAPEGSGFGAELLKIASSAPNLAHLCIGKTLSITAFPDGPPNAFTFKSLRSLKLIADPNAFILNFIRVLQAPQLESLWLGCRPFDSLTPSLKAHGGSRFPSLRYLTLQNYDFSNPAALSDMFPTITHLHLAYPHNTGANVISLFSSPTTQWWTHVHTFAIQTTHDAANDEDSAPNNVLHQLCTLISRRRQMNMPIKTLLFDPDLFTIAARRDWVGETFTMEVISPNNYHEYWWNLYEDEDLHTT